MKIKIRQRDASAIREDGWSETGDWLAELGNDNHAEPPGDDHAAPDGTDSPWAEAFAQADAHARARALAEAPEEAPTTPAAVMTPSRETGPEQLAITPSPAPAELAPVELAPAELPMATPRNRPRPLEVAQCSMCGIALPLALMVPDGGQACADIRWYCKDAISCTHRWTTATTPGPAHMPTAPDGAVAGTWEAAPGRASAERTDSMVQAAQSAV
jgi:hypothetical protein